MPDDIKADELEREAFVHIHAERWADARQCFENMLDLSLSPLRQVRTLRNIQVAYLREGMNSEAIAPGKRAIEIINRYDLVHASNEAAMLSGEIVGVTDKLEGKRSHGLPLLVSFAGAYITGAALGAVAGSHIQTMSRNIHGPVLTDLRYGGAVGGAIMGLLILSPLAKRMPILSGLAAFVSLCILFRVLTENTLEPGLEIMGLVLLVVPGLFFSLARVRAR
jgi:hypothetical protein